MLNGPSIPTGSYWSQEYRRIQKISLKPHQTQTSSSETGWLTSTVAESSCTPRELAMHTFICRFVKSSCSFKSYTSSQVFLLLQAGWPCGPPYKGLWTREFLMIKLGRPWRPSYTDLWTSSRFFLNLQDFCHCRALYSLLYLDTLDFPSLEDQLWESKPQVFAPLTNKAIIL